MGIFTKTRLGGVRRIVSSQSRHESNRRTRRLPLLILVALLSSFSFSAWAETETTYLFKQYSNGTLTGTNNETWTVEGTINSSASQFDSDITLTTAAKRGIAFTSYGSISSTFSVNEVTKIVLDVSTNGAGNKISEVKVGNTTLTTTENALTEGVKHAKLTYSLPDGVTSASGAITISCTRSKKTIWIGGLVVTTAGEALPTFSFSEKTVTAIIGKDFTAPTLTNEYETSVTYSSSDESVATVAADGTVTLVAAGTTTITATLDADNTVTTRYTLTVYTPTEGIIEELTYKTFDLTDQGYKEISYTSTITGTTYSGKASTNFSSLQLNDKEPQGIVAYNATRTLVAIKVDWNASTNNKRGLSIYGKTDEAYNSSNDLFSTSTQGTSLGSIAYSTSTAQLDLTNTENIGKYHAVGVSVSTTNGGAVYIDKITFVWSDGTTSNAFIDIKAKKAENNYFGTYYDEKAYTIDADGIVGYVIKTENIENEIVHTDGCKTFYKKDDVVPAKTALLYWSQVAGSYPITYTESDATAPADNLLHGGDMSALGSGYKFYKLAYADANLTDLGFYFGAADGAEFTLTNAHHAFLAVPESSAAKAFVIGGGVTAIDGVEPSVAADDAPVYSLSGVRMNGGNLPKGVYIKGGKKFVKK